MEKQNLKSLYLTLAASSAAGTFLIPKATWAGTSVLTAVCLMTTFFSQEKNHDERVDHLKLKAVRFALIASGFIAFGHAWASKGFGPAGHAVRYLSAFDILIVAMVIALGLFHYWRWQDGRVPAVAE